MALPTRNLRKRVGEAKAWAQSEGVADAMARPKACLSICFIHSQSPSSRSMGKAYPMLAPLKRKLLLRCDGAVVCKRVMQTIVRLYGWQQPIVLRHGRVRGFGWGEGQAYGLS